MGIETNTEEKDYTVLEYTASTYAMASGAVNSYVQRFSDFLDNQKVQVKWVVRGQVTAVSGLVNFIKEDDKIRAAFDTATGLAVGVAAGNATSALIALLAGLGVAVSAPVAIVIGIGVGAGIVYEITPQRMNLHF